jgi:hypothetical protein
MWRPSSSHFEVNRPPANNGWGSPIISREPEKPEWHSDIAKKKLFGTRLGKGDKPYDAAVFVFEHQSDALWALTNWIRDPIVVETRESVENQINLLDKDQLSAKLLRFAEERSAQGFPLHESKDRLAAYKLYAEIQGMMPKNGIDLSSKTFVANAMQITLVEAEQEQKPETKIIEHVEDQPLENALQVNLKLVG